LKTVLFALVLIALSLPRAVSQNTAAIDELHSGAREFLSHRYASAVRHFRRAETLDPSYKFTKLLIARTLHAQYIPRDRSPANVSRAHAAIDEYKKFLELDPTNYLARDAVSFLYDRLQEVDLQKEWLLDCGRSERFSKERRAECYIVLASKQWDCAYRITEQPVHKKAVENGKDVLGTSGVTMTPACRQRNNVPTMEWIRLKRRWYLIRSAPQHGATKQT
jgi:tetratricopeptide (TPR) repeat protein